MRTSFFCILALISSSVVVRAQNTAWPASNSTSNVGIGTATPISKFVVFGGNTTLWGLVLGYGTTNAIINTDDNTKPITFQIAGNEMMRVGNSGNIGIGTSNPLTKLHVNGGLFRVERNSNESMADFTNAIDANFDVILSTGGSADKKAYIGPTTNTNLALGQNGIEAMRITPGGNVAIGTTDPKGNKLAVAGSIIATEIKVKLQSQWPDYVFKPTYRLPSLTNVKAYIEKNNHLPDMPSAAEVAKNGVDLGEMNKLLLKKVEELTCYLIAKDKQMSKQNNAIKNLQKQVNLLKRNK